MKISNLLDKYKIVKNFEIVNEQEFETLALVESNTALDYCTFVDQGIYLSKIKPNVKMVITTPELKDDVEKLNIGACVVKEPRNLFFRLHNSISNDSSYKRNTFPTEIGDNCNISELSSVSPHNVKIGNNVLIEEFVVIRENTIIGDNCIIRAGAKIGGHDFEFKRDGDAIFSVEHCGGVIIGNNVEIQYNSGINRAVYPWDNTILEDYVKVDMLVHIAHGVKIGRATMIIANSGIGGRVEIGEESWIGFASTIRNGIKIGKHARVNMGSVVTQNVEDGQSVTGNFAISHDKFLSNLKSNR